MFSFKCMTQEKKNDLLNGNVLRNWPLLYTTQQQLVNNRPCHFPSESIVPLKGHCHGDFAVCMPKLLKYLTKNLFFNLKSLLEHQEE